MPQPPEMSPKAKGAYEKARREIAMWLEKFRSGALHPDKNALDLSGLGLTVLPAEIGHLSALTTLSLSDNQLKALPAEIGHLSALTTLSLSYNQLKALPAEIGQLSALTRLTLEYNQLKALPAEIGQLSALTRLALGDNQLTTLPVEIGQLSALTGLFLSHNQLKALPAEIGQLSALMELSLSRNQLEALPVEIGQLSALTALSLSHNQLTTLPAQIGQLSALDWLSLEYNHLTTLPAEIGKLSALIKLSLYGNQLTTLPAEIGQLSVLRWLELDHNQLTTLPEWLGSLPRLEHLHFYETLFNTEQRAIWKRGGWPALRAHLRAVAAEAEEVFTGKLMLVGEGAVGKSCLLDALRGLRPEKRATTHGMKRERLHLRLDGQLVTEPERAAMRGPQPEVIDFQCWDLGGQEAYQTTHQLFFTPEALYLMAYKGREDLNRGQVGKWLALIRNRATNKARVILVATHSGSQESVTPPDLGSLDEDLRAMILGFLAVDSFEPHNIAELRRTLATHAQREGYFRRRLPSGWSAFQEVLNEFSKPYVKLETVMEAAENRHRLARKASMGLLQMAHDVGLLLWHHQTGELENYVVLHPDWLSQAFAYVLKNPKAQRAHGIVKHSDLGKLWMEPPYPDSTPYPETVHAMLVALMEDNEISYRLPQGGRADGEMSLIAQLVEQQPPSEWGTLWTEQHDATQTEMRRLFSFLPPKDRKAQRLTGLMYRLIVRLHRYSLGQADYQQAVHWQSGMLLRNGDGDTARLEFRDDNELEIRVRGLIPVGFMHQLRETLREVVEDFWKGVKVREKALCGEHCPSGLKSEAFDVEECRLDLGDGREDIRCTVGACRKWVPLRSLLAPPAVAPAIKELQKLLAKRFDSLDAQVAAVQAKVESTATLMNAFLQLVREDIRRLAMNLMDDGHQGPRLFSVMFLEPGFWDKPVWVATRLQVTLWCEHSHLPLPFLGDQENEDGVYEIEVSRDWLVKAGSWLNITGRLVLYAKTLGVAGGLPEVAPATLKVLTDGAETVQKFADSLKLEKSAHIRVPGDADTPAVTDPDAPLSELAFGRTLSPDADFALWLREQVGKKDSTFAGMRKVADTAGKVLWVHPKNLSYYQSPPPRMT